MKKVYFLILSALALLVLVGCGEGKRESNYDQSPPLDTEESQEHLPSPNAMPPSMMVDGILYFSTGTQMSIEVEETEYLGKIISVVDITELPTEHGQANIPFYDAPYIKCHESEGFALLMDGKWILFEARKDE